MSDQKISKGPVGERVNKRRIMDTTKLGAFQKGLDFILYFENREFTLNDIADRYCVNHQHARVIKRQAGHLVKFERTGYKSSGRSGAPSSIWKITRR